MDKLSKDAITHLMRTSALLADTVQGTVGSSEVRYQAKAVEAAITAVRNLVPEFANVDTDPVKTYMDMRARRAG